MATCTVTYQGDSYPSFHGKQCRREAPHEGIRHSVVIDGRHLSWWTEDEKRQQMVKRDLREPRES